MPGFPTLPDEQFAPASLESLTSGDVIRVNGLNMDHVRLLANLENRFPPILVEQHTMRIVDGMHRFAAAKLRGDQDIDVQFFKGNREEAFIEAVRANSTHGLPLTLGDRRAAANRLVHAHSDWSDRMIAELVGLSPKTVGVVRRSSTEEIPQSRTRIGKDSRIRRLPARPSKQRNADGVAEDHVEPGMLQSAKPKALPCAQKSAPGPVPLQKPQRYTRITAASAQATYRAMCMDPSLRMTDTGRFLLRLLDLHLVHGGEWEQLPANLPPHRASSVVDLARECAMKWLDLADQASKALP
jgi:hypothetical protein